jgi:hypothetical protein
MDKIISKKVSPRSYIVRPRTDVGLHGTLGYPILNVCVLLLFYRVAIYILLNEVPCSLCYMFTFRFFLDGLMCLAGGPS